MIPPLDRLLAGSTVVGAGFREGQLQWLALSIRRPDEPVDLSRLVYVSPDGDLIKGEFTAEMREIVKRERDDRFKTVSRWGIYPGL